MTYGELTDQELIDARIDWLGALQNTRKELDLCDMELLRRFEGKVSLHRTHEPPIARRVILTTF